MRIRGLLGAAPLTERDGLWFPGVRAIHTNGMPFAIDVMFLKRSLDGVAAKWTVLSCEESLEPGRIAREPRADALIEFAAGSLARYGSCPPYVRLVAPCL